MFKSIVDPMSKAVQEAMIPDYMGDSQDLADKEQFWYENYQGDLDKLSYPIQDKIAMTSSHAADDEATSRQLTQSWMVDAVGYSPESVTKHWEGLKEEIANQFHANNLSEYEIYQSISLQHQLKRQQWDDLNEDYISRYRSVLANEHATRPEPTDNVFYNALRNQVFLSAEQEAQSQRDRLQSEYQQIKSVLDMMTGWNPVEKTIKTNMASGLGIGLIMTSQTPKILKAGQTFGTLSQEDQDIVLAMLRQDGQDAPEYWDAVAKSLDRGIQDIGYNLGQLGLNMVASAGRNFEWGKKADKTAQGLHQLRQFALNEYKPLSLNTKQSRWRDLSLDLVQQGTSTLLGFCGAGGITSLLGSELGQQMASARAKDPSGNFGLQMSGAFVSGVLNTGLSLGMNKLGQKIISRSIHGFRVSHSIDFLKKSGQTLGETSLMFAENKLQDAIPHAVQDSVSLLDGKGLGDGLSQWSDDQTLWDTQISEASLLLPYFLIGGGKMALSHFRSPYQMLNGGKELRAFGVSPNEIQSILSENDVNKANVLLKEALRSSPLWGSMYIPQKAFEWSHLLDAQGEPFLRNTQEACDFLQMKPELSARDWAQSDLPASFKEWKDQLSTDDQQKLIRSRWMNWAGLPKLHSLDSGAQSGYQLQYPAYMKQDTQVNYTSAEKALMDWENQLQREEHENLSMARFDDRKGLPPRIFESALDQNSEQIKQNYIAQRIQGIQVRPYRMLLLSYPELVMKNQSDSSYWDRLTQETVMKNKAVLFDGVMALVDGEKPQQVMKTSNKRLWSVALSSSGQIPAPWSSWLNHLDGNPECAVTKSKAVSLLSKASLLGVKHQDSRSVAFSDDFLSMNREIWGGLADINSLYHSLSNTQDFDRYISRGYAPREIYQEMLRKYLEVNQHDLEPYLKKSYDFQSPKEYQVSPSHALWSRMDHLGKSLMESTLGQDGETLWRVRYPNQKLSAWHHSKEQAQADYLGHLSMIYSPVSLTKTALLEEWRQGGNQGDFVQERLNRMKSNDWSQDAQTGYDQLGQMAVSDLIDQGIGRLSGRLPNLEFFVDAQGRRDARNLMSEEDIQNRSDILTKYGENHEILGIDASNKEIDTASGVLAHELTLYNQSNPLALIEDRAEIVWDRLIRSQQLDRAQVEIMLRDSNRLQSHESISSWTHSKMIEELSQLSKEYYVAHLADSSIPQSVRHWFEYSLADPRGENEVTRLFHAKKPSVTPLESMIAESVGMNRLIQTERVWAGLFHDKFSSWHMPMMERYGHRVMDASLLNYVPESLKKGLIYQLNDSRQLFGLFGEKRVQKKLDSLAETLRAFPELGDLKRSSVDRNQVLIKKDIEDSSVSRTESIWDEVILPDIMDPEWVQDLTIDRKSVDKVKLLQDPKIAEDFHTLSDIRDVFDSYPLPTNEGVYWNDQYYRADLPARPQGVSASWVADVPLSRAFESVYLLDDYDSGPVYANLPFIADPEQSFSEMASCVIYRDGQHPAHSVRLMPGLPENPLMTARHPYVVHCMDGVYLNKEGKVARTFADTYIPLEEFNARKSQLYHWDERDRQSQQSWANDIYQTVGDLSLQESRWWGKDANSCMLEDMIRVYEEGQLQSKLKRGEWKLNDPQVIQTLRMVSHVLNSPMLLRLPYDNQTKTHELILKEGRTWAEMMKQQDKEAHD